MALQPLWAIYHRRLLGCIPMLGWFLRTHLIVYRNPVVMIIVLGHNIYYQKPHQRLLINIVTTNHRAHLHFTGVVHVGAVSVLNRHCPFL